MKLADLFEQLAYGELSNMAASNPIGTIPLNDSGELSANQYGKIIVAANDALNTLFSRFILGRDMLIMPTLAGVRKYPVIADNMVQILYVDMDTDYTSYDVYNADEFFSRKFSIFNKNTIVFSADPILTEMRVEYQTTHARLRMGVEDMEEQIINIPVFVEEAFRSLVASKVFAQMSTEVAMARSIDLNNKFETSVAILESRGLLETNIPIERRDFRESGLV